VKKNQFVVIGLGEYGFSLAKSLAENGAYVLAVDHDLVRIEEIKNYVDQAIQFDATNPKLLKEHGIFSADIVIVAIGDSFEPVVLISMELLKAEVGRIIARASSNTEQMILNKIGVKEVIHPEKDEGVRMATSLMSSSITDYFKLSDEVGIFEIEAPKDMIGYSLLDLKIRQRYNLNLLTIKRPKIKESDTEEEVKLYDVLGVIEPSFKIKEGDKLLLMGAQEAIDKLINTN
tara:strand:- start:8125 stop:8820 length:696 start_codon:yes stop_codon:yes gene_type:complete